MYVFLLTGRGDYPVYRAAEKTKTDRTLPTSEGARQEAGEYLKNRLEFFLDFLACPEVLVVGGCGRNAGSPLGAGSVVQGVSWLVTTTVVAQAPKRCRRSGSAPTTVTAE